MLFSRYESLCVKKIAGGAPHKVGPLPEEVQVQAAYSADGTKIAVRTQGGGDEAEAAQRLYLQDARSNAELDELASAGEDETLPSQIGPVFAWQPKTTGAY
jgi:hypothetical protein